MLQAVLCLFIVLLFQSQQQKPKQFPLRAINLYSFCFIPQMCAKWLDQKRKNTPKLKIILMSLNCIVCVICETVEMTAVIKKHTVAEIAGFWKKPRNDLEVERLVLCHPAARRGSAFLTAEEVRAVLCVAPWHTRLRPNATACVC